MDIQRDRPKNRQMNRGTVRGDYLGVTLDKPRVQNKKRYIKTWINIRNHLQAN